MSPPDQPVNRPPAQCLDSHGQTARAPPRDPHCTDFVKDFTTGPGVAGFLPREAFKLCRRGWRAGARSC